MKICYKDRVGYVKVCDGDLLGLKPLHQKAIQMVQDYVKDKIFSHEITVIVEHQQVFETKIEYLQFTVRSGSYSETLYCRVTCPDDAGFFSFFLEALRRVRVNVTCKEEKL